MNKPKKINKENLDYSMKESHDGSSIQSSFVYVVQ